MFSGDTKHQEHHHSLLNMYNSMTEQTYFVGKNKLEKNKCSYKLRNNGSIVFWYVRLSSFEEPVV